MYEYKHNIKILFIPNFFAINPVIPYNQERANFTTTQSCNEGKLQLAETIYNLSLNVLTIK